MKNAFMYEVGQKCASHFEITPFAATIVQRSRSKPVWPCNTWCAEARPTEPAPKPGYEDRPWYELQWFEHEEMSYWVPEEFVLPLCMDCE